MNSHNIRVGILTHSKVAEMRCYRGFDVLDLILVVLAIQDLSETTLL